jgi:hypothetical protein
MAASPSFAATPKTGIATISTINTNRDGTGTIVALFTPGASGSRATSAKITATVTTSAQLVRLYRSVDSGSTWKLWQEVPIAAVTIAAGTPGATATVSLLDASGSAIGLASTDRLGAAAETANNMVIVTEYADL